MPGKIGILDTLSPEQKALLLTWLDSLPTSAVVERVAKPPPDGFGIHTHITSLRRFYEYSQREEEPVLQESALHLAASEHLPTFEKATCALLLRQAYKFASSPEGNERHFDKACSWLLAIQKQRHRQQQLELARQKLDLEAKRAELDAASVQLKACTHQDVETIRQVRERIFGKVKP
jgi:hypothetical protein